MNQTKVNWDTTRTDLAIFDTSIIDKYNPDRNYNIHLRWISPQRFIEYQYKTIEAGYLLAPGQTGIEPFWKGINRPTVEQIKTQIKAGIKFFAFALEFDKEGNITYFQEGRHRAVAMLELGIKRIPVYFAYKRF